MFLLLAYLAPAKEPEYNGKALSEWLVELQGDLSDQEVIAATGQNMDPAKLIDQKKSRAREAIRQIGTNAIPTLVDLLGVTDENRLVVLRKLKSAELRKWIHAESAFNSVLSEMALEGFGILGTNAVPAIPQIGKLFNKVETCSEAAQALVLLGPDGVVALTNGLASKNNDIRGITLWAIGEKSGMDSNTMMRIMLNGLKDPDSNNRADAARFLAHKDPVVAIPALVPMLDDDAAYVVDYAARALSSYGPAAKVAIPKLFTLYTNAVVQRDKTKIDTIQLMPALKAIDMEAAKQAEGFLVNSGPLGVEGYGWTTTLLSNGKELIAGGYLETSVPKVTSHIFARAVLHDPVTGKWTQTGQMNTARYTHAAVLLRDGKGLVAGGRDSRSNDIPSAELYDPTTGTWKETGPMSNARSSCHALLQSNGKALVFSGRGTSYSPASNKELYDPDTGTWKKIPPEPAFDKALFDEATSTWKLPSHHKSYE